MARPRSSHVCTVLLATGQTETCRVYLEGGGWDRWDLSAAVIDQDDAGADLRAELVPAPADGKAKPIPGHRDVRLRAVSGRGEFTVRVAAVSTSGRGPTCS